MAGRVLHLISQRPGWTGSGIAIEAIVRAADKKGWDQALVCGIASGDPVPVVGDLHPSRIHPLLFETELLPFAIPGMSDVMPYPSSRFSSLTNQQIAKYCEVWKRHVGEVIERFRPDVVHSHHFWLLSALIKDINTELPVVTHCHGTGFRQLMLCPHLENAVCLGCQRNERFVVLHHDHAALLQKKAEIESNRIRVVGSGFHPDLFHPHGRSSDVGNSIAYAGKLSHAKGVPWLLEAVTQLAAIHPDLAVHVAGSGAGPEAEALVRKMQSMDFVHHHGQLDQARLADLMRTSSVFVLPSFYEGLPLVLVEAAACGCRLVTTALPGVTNQLVPEIGAAIELVPLPRIKDSDIPVTADLPAFVDNLAHALQAALNSPPLENAEQLVKTMTWDAVFDRLEEVWCDTLR